ncbi:MAG: hypothetical protein KC425_02035, partial [Anaerolineales bacterium]|nr:hypothetical protein [Anaerolineales bacterium]
CSQTWFRSAAAVAASPRAKNAAAAWLPWLLHNAKKTTAVATKIPIQFAFFRFSIVSLIDDGRITSGVMGAGVHDGTVCLFVQKKEQLLRADEMEFTASRDLLGRSSPGFSRTVTPQTDEIGVLLARLGHVIG